MKTGKKTRKRRGAVPLPMMMAELTLASCETIARRTWMMAQGSCSAAEYQRMVLEKAKAAQQTGLALAFPRGKDGVAAALAPWHRAASANARRLRRK